MESIHVLVVFVSLMMAASQASIYTCDCDEEVLACTGEVDSGHVVVIDGCEKADSFFFDGLGFVKGIFDQREDRKPWKSVQISRATLTCSDVMKALEASKAVVNGESCGLKRTSTTTAKVHLQTSGPAIPVFTVHFGGDDDDDHPDVDHPDDDHDNNSDDTDDDRSVTGPTTMTIPTTISTTRHQTTSGTSLTTATTNATTHRITTVGTPFADLKTTVTLYQWLLIITISIVVVGSTWYIVVRIRFRRVARQRPVQVEDVSSTSYVLRQVPRSPRRRKGSTSGSLESQVLFAVDEV